jgi:hypothetical protein
MTAAVAAVTPLPLPAARTAVGLLAGYDAFVDTLPISSWKRSVRRVGPPDVSSRSTVIWWDG